MLEIKASSSWEEQTGGSLRQTFSVWLLSYHLGDKKGNVTSLMAAWSSQDISSRTMQTLSWYKQKEKGAGVAPVVIGKSWGQGFTSHHLGNNPMYISYSNSGECRAREFWAAFALFSLVKKMLATVSGGGQLQVNVPVSKHKDMSSRTHMTKKNNSTKLFSDLSMCCVT